MATTIAAPVQERTLEEALLTRRARDGDGEAFAALYDRYEQRVHNLCYRLLDSRDDAADATQEAFISVLERLPRLEDRTLNFGSYVFTAARNECYDLIARRRRAMPADQPALEAGVSRAARRDPGSPAGDPARSALIASQQEEIRRANAQLPVRQREALALRELGELSYDEIGELLGMNRNAVAQLISRARIGLRDALRRSAVGAIAAAGPECARALPLLALRDDRELADPEAVAWLRAHASGCAHCRAAGEAIAEAGASYRAWAPIAATAWLFDDTIAKAAARRAAGVGAGGRMGARGRRALGVGALALVVLLVALAGATGAGEIEDSAAEPAGTTQKPALGSSRAPLPAGARLRRDEPAGGRERANTPVVARNTAPSRPAAARAATPTARPTTVGVASRAPAGRRTPTSAPASVDRRPGAVETAPSERPAAPAAEAPAAIAPPPTAARPPAPPPSAARPPAAPPPVAPAVRPPPPPVRPPPPPPPTVCRDPSGAPIACPPR